MSVFPLGESDLTTIKILSLVDATFRAANRERARARYRSLVVAEIGLLLRGRRLFITPLKLMEIYALDSRQDDKDNSRARDSLIGRGGSNRI